VNGIKKDKRTKGIKSALLCRIGWLRAEMFQQMLFCLVQHLIFTRKYIGLGGVEEMRQPYLQRVHSLEGETDTFLSVVT
jgi:hypothetical protein